MGEIIIVRCNLVKYIFETWNGVRKDRSRIAQVIFTETVQSNKLFLYN